MTPLQKNIITVLLDGGTLAGNQKYGYRVRTATVQPVHKFGYRSFLSIRNLLRKKDGVYYINKNLVRQLHGSCFIKKTYKQKTMQS